MSYVQVNMGGKLRGMKFNKMAQLIVSEKVVPGNTMSGVYALVYAGLSANCYVKGEPEDFTFEQVCDWADELSAEDSNKIKAAFEQTEMYKQGQAYLAEIAASSKKKAAPKPSKNIKPKVSK